MYICIDDVFCTSLCSLMNSMGQPLAQGGSTMSPSGSPLCLVPTLHILYSMCIHIMSMYVHIE